MSAAAVDKVHKYQICFFFASPWLPNRHLYMKTFLLALALVFGSSCRKTSGTSPKEYFSCIINGVYFTYKQDPTSNHDALIARPGQITLPAYQIAGDNVVDFPYTGINFWLINKSFPDKDTVILSTYEDGAYATINYPQDSTMVAVDFSTDSNHTGRIIFTKRSPSELEGTFSFDAQRAGSSTVLHITEGKFSIKPQ